MSELSIYWINFIVYCAGMYFILRKPALSAWSARREAIKLSAEKNKVDLDLAMKQLNASQEKLKNVSKEAEQLRAAIVKEATLESESIIALAKIGGQKTMQRSKDAVEKEKQLGMRAIERSIVAEALKKVEEKLKNSQLAFADDKLVEKAFVSASELIN